MTLTVMLSCAGGQMGAWECASEATLQNVLEGTHILIVSTRVLAFKNAFRHVLIHCFQALPGILFKTSRDMDRTGDILHHQQHIARSFRSSTACTSNT